MTWSFARKLAASHAALVVGVVILVLLELYGGLRRDLRAEVDRRLEQQARGAAEWVAAGRHPEKLAERLGAIVDADVEVVDARGVVIGNSTGKLGQSVALDPEISGARAGQVAHAVRHDVAYVAIAAGDSVLRLSTPLAGIEDTLAAMRARLLVSAAIALGLALIAGVLVARRAARPLVDMARAAERIAEGDYGVRLSFTGNDEVAQLAAALSSMAARIEADVERIRQLERVRRDFVANVSHELQTPITAIQGYSETLLAGGVSPEQARAFLAIVERQAGRMAELVRDLLQLGAIEAGEQAPPQRVPVTLAAVVAEVIAALRPRAQGATLVSTVDDRVAVLADPASLERVLENLLGNALRHGGAAGTVTVSAEPNGPDVRLIVSDTGPGIAAEHLPRLFERFYRVDAGRARDAGGTGLGLAIVKHLVERMGGEVHAESAVGQGTRFVVRLGRADGV